MTSPAFCPQCGTPRVGSMPYCATCQYDFTGNSGPGQSLAPPPGPSAAAEPPAKGFPWFGILIAAILLVGAATGAYIYFKGQVDQIFQNVADNLASGNPGGGGSLPGVPPAGEAWFGSSFDTDTFAIRNRKVSVGAHEAFAVVAHLPRTLDGSDLVIRVYLDGSLISTTGANATGSGDIWGFSPGPLFEPGTWKYEFTDLGGNVLASGTVTATQDP